MNTFPTGKLPAQLMLQGRYMIIKSAGQGGMGSVYEAIDTVDANRRVAIKEMKQSHLEIGELAEAQKRFIDEGNMLSGLSHEHLPRFYSSFVENNRPYLVMEFVEGDTLAELLAVSANGSLPISDVIKYAICLCNVLNYLHQQMQPIIFRDLKPSNIMVTKSGHLYLIDFGIARYFKWGQTADTTNFGTPGFCAPEQLGSGQTGPQSDLYSLGATLHYCLTSHNPKDNSPTLFNFLPIRTYNPLVPRDLDNLVQELVATHKDKRPHSASDVLVSLQRAQKWAGDTTAPLSVANSAQGTFYDPQAARTAQFRIWLNRLSRLQGRVGVLAGVWWVNQAVPFIIHFYSLLVALVFWLGKTSQRAWQGVATSTNNGSQVWTRKFKLAFALLLITTLGGSLYLLDGLHWSPHGVALLLCISLLMFITNAVFQSSITHPLARSILLATALALLLICLALPGESDIQAALATTTLNQALCWFIVVISLFAVARPKQRFIWLDHFTLALIAVLCCLLQFEFGVAALQKFSFISDPVNTNSVLVAILGLIAILALFWMKSALQRKGLFLTLIVAILSIELHYFVGPEELWVLPLLSLSAASNASYVAAIHVTIMALPILAAFFLLFSPFANSRWSRLGLVVLACAFALIQLRQGQSVVWSLSVSQPNPFATRLTEFETMQQLLPYGVLLIGILLLCRLIAAFNAVDLAALFSIALLCIILQFAIWSYQENIHGATLLYQVAFNKYLVVFSLLILVLVRLVVGIFALVLHLIRQHTPLNNANTMQKPSGAKKVATYIERVLLVSLVLICLTLQWNFGGDEPLFGQSFNISNIQIPANDIALILIGCVCVFACIRMLGTLNRPFTSWDRLPLLVVTFVCALLLFSYRDKNIAFATQQWVHFPPLILPTTFVVVGTLLAALLSFFWLRRSFPLYEHRMLLLFAAATTTCAILQFFGEIFVVFFLILLIQGIFLAIGTEKRR